MTVINTRITLSADKVHKSICWSADSGLLWTATVVRGSFIVVVIDLSNSFIIRDCLMTHGMIDNNNDRQLTRLTKLHGKCYDWRLL